MDLPFSKMHGAGNDFVVLDGRQRDPGLARDSITAMADRHTGIGFDQLLLIDPARSPDGIAGYRIFNADGSTAGQCGNGARCIVAWLHRHAGAPLGQTLHLDSPAGRIGARLWAPLDVSVEMGEPDFDPRRAGFTGSLAATPTLALDVDGHQHAVQVVSMGNPHAVLTVASLSDPTLETLGPALGRQPEFADGCNAGFVHVIDPHHVELRVHERGAGWTRACGSGACAAAAAMIGTGRCANPVRVTMPGGTLAVDWPGPGRKLWMRGPAAFVFEGMWPLS